MNFIPKIVDDNHYHLWTDVLHARQLARQSGDRWNRGSYVRWTVIIGWTVLEVACQEALGDTSISYSFRRNLDAAIQRCGLAPIEWGNGIWQQVSMLQERRKGYVHRFLETNDLFPSSAVADEAVETIRSAVAAVYEMTQQPPPAWLADDSDGGWPLPSMVFGHVAAVRAGVDTNSPETIRLAAIFEGVERVCEYMPPDADYMQAAERLLRQTNVPISRVIVYKGDSVIYSRDIDMRGT